MHQDRPPLKVFISYSSKDDEFRSQLEAHLAVLRRQGMIDDWHFRKILPGDEWEKEISEELDHANIVLLLVSADFLASDYCYDIEMRRALERHDSGTARVMPIIVRAVDWRSAPFSKLQTLPTDAVPVAEWTSPDRAWLTVTDAIRELSKKLRAEAAPSRAPLTPSDVEPSTATVGTEDLAAAESVVKRGAEAGNADAAIALGALLDSRGEAAGAEQWYRRAAEGGNRDAASNLGELLLRTGREEEAEEVLRESAEAGHAMSMFNLGVVLAGRGASEEAKLWYRKSVDAGNALAANNLGQLVEQEGHPDDARRLYRQSAEAGNPKAAYNLGLHLQKSGDLDGARAWYRRAAEQGNPNGANNLAVLSEQACQLVDAEHWYRQAAAQGHLGATNNLGVLLVERGDRGEGLELLRRAAAAGHLEAASNLLSYSTRASSGAFYRVAH
jgi:TPR repeat protein